MSVCECVCVRGGGSGAQQSRWVNRSGRGREAEDGVNWASGCGGGRGGEGSVKGPGRHTNHTRIIYHKLIDYE